MITSVYLRHFIHLISNTKIKISFVRQSASVCTVDWITCFKRKLPKLVETHFKVQSNLFQKVCKNNCWKFVGQVIINLKFIYSNKGLSTILTINVSFFFFTFDISWNLIFLIFDIFLYLVFPYSWKLTSIALKIYLSPTYLIFDYRWLILQFSLKCTRWIKKS